MGRLFDAHHLSSIVNIESSDIMLNAFVKQYLSKLRARFSHNLCRDERQSRETVNIIFQVSSEEMNLGL